MHGKLLTAILLLLLASPFVASARDYTPQQCPVVGNTNSRIYHTPGGRHYRQMLQENKRGDNRVCFRTEEAAKAAGYRKSKT